MARERLYCAVAVCSAALAAPQGIAEIVVFEFTVEVSVSHFAGDVTHLPDINTGLTTGDTFIGHFAFDSETPNRSAAETGSYALGYVSLFTPAGTMTMSNEPPNRADLVVVDGSPGDLFNRDALQVHGFFDPRNAVVGETTARDRILLSFADSSETALTGYAPPSMLDISAWESAEFRCSRDWIRQVNHNTTTLLGLRQLDGRVIDIRRIPGPGAAVLLGLTVALTARRRR